MKRRTTPLNGDLVLVRGYKNKPYTLRVCEFKRDTIYVTGLENFKALQAGEGVNPIPVKQWEVHPYDSDVQQRLAETAPDNMDIWNALDIWER